MIDTENKDVVTRTMALCIAFGWQGGTIHQLADVTGCSANELLYSPCQRYTSDWSAGWCAYRTCSIEYNQNNLHNENKGNLQFWLGVASGVQTSIKMKQETTKKF
jgi:hypothetical protein